MTKPLAALLLILAALAAAPPSAHAGSYVLVGCADLAGALTPNHVVRPAEGWYLEQGVYPSRNECPAGLSGRGLFATGAREPNLFRLDAPAHTTIARLVVTYRARLSGAEEWAVPTLVVQAGHGGSWEYIGPARGHIGAQPIELGADRAVGEAHGADALRIGTRCDLRGPCFEGGEPEARFRALAVVLTDDRAPALSLSVPSAPARGEVDLRLAATDEGGGVYDRSVAVDDRPLAGGALCATVPGSLGPARHVLRRVPCPLDAPARVRLDTRGLGDGPHAVRARVEDVAGNVREAEATLVVDNLPPRAGTVALIGEAAVSEALTAVPGGFTGQDVAYRYRWERCDGGGCREIGGAVGDTYALRPGDAGRRVRAVVTASDGGGSVRVASGESAVVAGAATGPAGGFAVAAPAAEAPRGRLTAWLERGRRRLRRTTVTWPSRVRVRGRLTDLAGRPLGRTVVRMHERIDGGRRRELSGVRTRADGRLTTFTRMGPSRRVRLAYGDSAVTLRVAVRATARVHVRRTGSVTMVWGRLRGGHVPRAGIRVRLQASRGGRWSTRAVLRTDGLGRFAATGRAAPGTRFRIVIPARPGYPFASGVGRP